MKLLVVGDSHGDLNFYRKHVIPIAERFHVDTILQVGDWGYWEHTTAGLKFLHHLNLALFEMTLYWIDGNHENHTLLRQVYLAGGGPPVPVNIRSNIVHLPRGSTIELGGRKFLACGGAFSIDKESRATAQDVGSVIDGTRIMDRHVSWWPEETIDPKDVKRCQSAGRADVLLSHDCPLGVPPKGEHGLMKECDETHRNRELLTQVMDNARVRLVMHGHWHHYHDDRTDAGVRVVGLDCNTTPGRSMAILDTDDLAVAPVHELVWAEDHELPDRSWIRAKTENVHP